MCQFAPPPVRQGGRDPLGGLTGPRPERAAHLTHRARRYRKTRLAVAQVLGIETTGAEPAVQMLRNALRSRSLVLILDNLEHLCDDLSLISALLQACPSLTVVATSRVRLSLSGEHIVPVESLAVTTSNDHLPVDEAAQSSAVKLFVD